MPRHNETQEAAIQRGAEEIISTFEEIFSEMHSKKPDETTLVYYAFMLKAKYYDVYHDLLDATPGFPSSRHFYPEISDSYNVDSSWELFDTLRRKGMENELQNIQVEDASDDFMTILKVSKTYTKQ